MHSLRFKITAITIASVVVTVLSAMLASYYIIRDENVQESVDIMNLIGDNTKQSLEKYFDSVEQSVEMAANLAIDTLDPVILAENGASGLYSKRSAQTPEQAAKLDAYLTDYCENLHKILETVASNTYGIVSYYYCINPDISETMHGFFYSKVGKTGFDEREPLNALTLDPGDAAHTAWYYETIRRGRPSWIGPYSADTLNDLWICSYAVPVYKSGEVIGVLGMDIPIETLASQVSSIRVYETGYAALFDEQAHAIYHPSLKIGESPDVIGVSVTAEDLRARSSGDSPVRYELNGQLKQLAFTTLSNGMKVAVIAPVGEINADWGVLAITLLSVTAFLILLIIFALFFIVRLLTNPLRDLTAASQRLAAGDYSVALNTRGKDEIGMLTAAFSGMRDQIGTYIDDLKRRINTDSLTGLPNMRYFFTLAEGERRRLIGEGAMPAVMYFDLIGIKHYNRQFGFDEGDKLLRAIGNILREQFGAQNIGRFSGDHFVAIADENGLETRLEAVIDACRNANGGNSLPIRIGVYPIGHEIVNPNVACDRAKYACDRHRGVHASGFYFFDTGMIRQIDDARYILDKFEQALSERWIDVYYQPLIRSVSGSVCDEEALSRWIDPVRGVLPPSLFVPVLERANLIYKLDLYVLDRVLEKMQAQRREGLWVMPHSLNLSRSDFDSCDIVEEIRSRVDAAGIARDRLTVEITESIVAGDLAFMKEQIARFRALGFCVWMDDFGSGYSSLGVLQDIRFDVLKFDISFMKRFYEKEECKVILSELIRMAIDLGIDTVCEGVETKEQVEFLREVGCTKLQGYYFCKPIPYGKIVERYRSGTQIGFENPQESDYLSAIGRVNLYDLSVIAGAEEDTLGDFYDMLPVAIIEVGENGLDFVRFNPAYRDFMKRYFGIDLMKKRAGYTPSAEHDDLTFMKHVRQCCADGNRVFFDGDLKGGAVAHTVIRRIGVDPVAGKTAVGVSVLSVIDAEHGGTYANIARTLAADYYNIYVVDMNTGDFIEYSSPIGGQELAMERRGKRFFEQLKDDVPRRIYEQDREAILTAFTKENIQKELDREGVFLGTYRIIDSGVPLYANMKVMRVQPQQDRIIIGISLADAVMRQREAENRADRERVAFERIAALAGNYLAIYSIDPETGHYIEFDASKEYARYGLEREGEDFFVQARKNAPRAIDPNDLPNFLRILNRQTVLRAVHRKGVFTIHYRLVMNGKTIPVNFRVVMVKEPDGEKLIAGIMRVEEQTQLEPEKQAEPPVRRTPENKRDGTAKPPRNA